MERGRRPAIPLYVQAAGLRSAFPNGRAVVAGSKLKWDGSLQPTALSPTYDVRLEYTPGTLPRSFLVRPNGRELADSVIADRALPHIYGEKPLVEMCIFHPKKREWNSGMQMALTIVPWMSMWLSFFEDWLITDIWSGGGEHPVLPKKPSSKSEEIPLES